MSFILTENNVIYVTALKSSQEILNVEFNTYGTNETSTTPTKDPITKKRV